MDQMKIEFAKKERSVALLNEVLDYFRCIKDHEKVQQFCLFVADYEADVRFLKSKIERLTITNAERKCADSEDED